MFTISLIEIILMIISIGKICMATIINEKLCSRGLPWKVSLSVYFIDKHIDPNFLIHWLFFFIIYMHSCERSCSFFAATKIDKIKKFQEIQIFKNYISLIYTLTARFIKFSILYSCMNIERRR